MLIFWVFPYLIGLRCRGIQFFLNEMAIQALYDSMMAIDARLATAAKALQP